MISHMKKIDFTELNANVAKLVGQQWMLISAGSEGVCGKDFNMMTASWGGLGFVWNKPVAFVFIRPNRHTHRFVEANELLTLSFMPEAYRQDLVFCGRHSGCDVDKVAETKLRPFATEGGGVAMQDADVVLECRKLFRAPLKQEDFLDWSAFTPRFYAEDNPLHDLYVCEITGAWIREEA